MDPYRKFEQWLCSRPAFEITEALRAALLYGIASNINQMKSTLIEAGYTELAGIGTRYAPKVLCFDTGEGMQLLDCTRTPATQKQIADYALAYGKACPPIQSGMHLWVQKDNPSGKAPWVRFRAAFLDNAGALRFYWPEQKKNGAQQAATLRKDSEGRYPAFHSSQGTWLCCPLPESMFSV